MDEYNERLCGERHVNVNSNIERLWEKYDEVSRCNNKKFNQIMAGIVITLISVIGSLITIIATRTH